jgi:hypothetical protein
VPAVAAEPAGPAVVAEPAPGEPPPAAAAATAQASESPSPLRPADWLEPLQSAPWADALAPHPGWHWDLSRGGLFCPNAQLLRLDRLKPNLKLQSLGLHFRAPFSACSRCPLRGGCTESPSPRFQKELTLRFHASRLPEIDLPALARSLGSAPAASSRAPAPPLLPPLEPAWLPPPPQPSAAAAAAGPWPVRWPMLLPCVLSQAFASACLALEVVLCVLLPSSPPALPPYIAASPAERQRRRKTWQQRLAAGALPPHACVLIELHGAPSSLALLGLSASPSPALLPSAAPSEPPPPLSAERGEGRERQRATRAERRPRNRTG